MSEYSQALEAVQTPEGQRKVYNDRLRLAMRWSEFHPRAKALSELVLACERASGHIRLSDVLRNVADELDKPLPDR